MEEKFLKPSGSIPRQRESQDALASYSQGDITAEKLDTLF